MAKGKQVEIKAVEDIPIYDDEGDESTVRIQGTRAGRVRFEGEALEPFEIDLEELVAALLHIDTSGGFARRILNPPEYKP